MRSRSPLLDQAARPGQARPAAPSDAVSRPSSRSSRQSSGSPTIARRARLGGPGPSEPRGRGPRGNTGELASSWLHPLKSWSLRKTRGGSVESDTAYHSFAGEVEARTPPRYAAFFPSGRLQLLRIARNGHEKPGARTLRGCGSYSLGSGSGASTDHDRLRWY